MKVEFRSWTYLGWGLVCFGLTSLMLSLQLAGTNQPDYVQITSTLASVLLAAGAAAIANGLHESRIERRRIRIIKEELDQTIEVFERTSDSDFKLDFGQGRQIAFQLAPAYDIFLGQAAELDSLEDEGRKAALLLCAKIRAYTARFERLQSTLSRYFGGLGSANVDLLVANLRAEIQELSNMAGEIVKVGKQVREALPGSHSEP